MVTRRARRIPVLVLMLAALTATYVSAQGTPPDIKSLAGTWTGYASPTRGSNVQLQIVLKPDGSYTSQWGSTMGKGMVKTEGGKLVAEGNLISGTRTVEAGTGKSELAVTSQGETQIITGVGRDDDGPFNFRLTKQK